MNIYVCVGSSCHLKGSYQIIELMKKALEDNGLTDQVNLSAAFCLGKCTHGVTIKVDDEIVTGAVSYTHLHRLGCLDCVRPRNTDDADPPGS